MIQIRLTPTSARFEHGVIPAEALNEISDTLSYDVQGAEHMKLYKEGKWDGKKRLYNRGTKRFPPGLLAKVLDILDSHGIEYNIDYAYPTDRSMAGLPDIDPVWGLRDYQNEAVEAALDAQRCMVRVATGGGKTVIAGHIIHRVNEHTIFLVHTKDLLYQAKEIFTAMFGADSIGQIGDGVIDPRAITVCTLQTAARALNVKYVDDEYSEGEDSWESEEKGKLSQEAAASVRTALERSGLIIMDECHRVAAPTAMDVMDSVKNAVYRIGLSASPWRDDGADIALEGIFGKVAVDINASELIGRGFLVPPIIRVVKVPPAYVGFKYSEVYSNYVVKNATRNTMGVVAASGMVKRGVQTMILVRQIGHGESVAKQLTEAVGFSVPFISGKDSSSTRLDVIRDLRSGNLGAVVATTIADEGLDIKPLGGLVLLGAGKSSVRALQRIGRVLRPSPGKTRAEVVDFEDNAKYLLGHTQRRVEIYETESAFTIVDV